MNDNRWIWSLIFSLALLGCDGSGNDADTDGSAGGDGSTSVDGGPHGSNQLSPGELDPACGEDGFILSPNPPDSLIQDGQGAAGLFNTRLGRVTDQGQLDPALDLHQPGQGYATQLLRTTQGKFIAFGAGYYDRYTLERLNADGSPDPSFGVKMDEIGGVSHLALHSDGTMVVTQIGTDEQGLRQIAVVKLLPDGSLDKSFGQQGRAMTAFDDDTDCRFVAITAEKRVVVVGSYGFTPALAVFTPDGVLDSAFGDAGQLLLTGFGPRYPRDLDLDPQGRILVLGMVGDTIQIARVLADGKLDGAFGQAGMAELQMTMPLSSEYDEHVEARVLHLQPDGRILVAANYAYDLGEDDVYEEQSILVARFDDRGQLDTLFGEQGYVRVSLGPDQAPSFLAQRDGLTLLAGDRILLGGRIDGHDEQRGGMACLRR